jgi:hypothetical protein
VSALLAHASPLGPVLLAALLDSFSPGGALMGLGLLIAIWGHLIRSRWLIASGLIMIAVSVVLLQVTFKTTSHGPPPPTVPEGGSG